MGCGVGLTWARPCGGIRVCLAFQQGHQGDAAQVGFKLLAVILVLQPGEALGRWATVEDQPGGAFVVLHLDDGLFQLVGVWLLLFLLGVRT